MIGTITESVARVVGSERDKEPLCLGEMIVASFVGSVSLDSELCEAVERALEDAGSEPLVWPELDGLFSVRWASRRRGQSAEAGEEVVGASGGDWMERTFDALNRVVGINGLENDSTWELRDGVAVVNVWISGRHLIAFVEEIE